MPPPVVTINPNNVTIKVFESVTFVCSAIGFGGFLFKWESLNLIQYNSSLTIDSVLPQHQGQYRCTATSLFSNLSSDAVATLHIKGNYLHTCYCHHISLCFIAPLFYSQTTLLHQISFNASTDTITVFIPQVDDSGGPIR